LTVSALGQQFVPRRQGTWAGALSGTEGATEMAALAGKYVVVLPFTPSPLARSRPIPI
jgi:hypothetical protein